MMKEELQGLVRGAGNPLEARNTLREALQANILAGLQRGGGMVSLAFHGGTALRFLYALPRFSEDLDFSLRNASEYDFRRLVESVVRELKTQGYAPGVKVSDQRAVHNAYVGFPGLLHELGLSGRASEALAVKLEIDTQPPPGATYATTVVRKHVLLNLSHHDQPTLLAGKLHAILQRPYLKGRDLYDLAWYLADPAWPAPNLRYLNQALAQTGWKGPGLTEESWRGVVRRRLAGADLKKAAADVAPFLRDPREVDMVSAARLGSLLAAPGRDDEIRPGRRR